MREGLVRVLADNQDQGTRLHKNFLGMKDKAELPAQTRFLGIPYAFSVRLKEGNEDVVRLTWHDYPGEWFEQNVTGEEAKRRVDTFRGLLGSDVAFLLVDGQRLLENAGEEERYLKSLFASFSNGLLLLKDDLLVNKKPLVTFPRIWILALSKADLLPEPNVFKFRDIIISKVDEEIADLRKVLKGFVTQPEALSVGEDFVLLSSAKFEANSIEVTERIGLDLILPLAALLPLQRHVRWIDQKKAVGDLAEEFVSAAGPLAAAFTSKAGWLFEKFVPGNSKMWANLSAVSVNWGVQRADKTLKEKNSKTTATYGEMKQVLDAYEAALNKGEAAEVLLLSRR